MKVIRVFIYTLAMIAVIGAAVRAENAPGSKEQDAAARKEQVEKIQAAVQEICLSMKPFMERPDTLKSISVEDNAEVNAFADDKGNIVFFTGMADFVRNENEIAAVCGHEMTHLSAQHIKRSIGTSILATIAETALGGTIGNLAGNAIFTKQSRKHERESDERGLLYMWNAGYDPRSIWGFWQCMGNQFKGGNDVISKFLSTHPASAERTEDLKVLLVRHCTLEPTRPYCDEIMKDQSLLDLYKAYENR